MPGNATLDPYQTPFSDIAYPMFVCRYDRGQPAGERYSHLPNVYCRGIEFSEGHTPPSARFEYVLDDVDPDSPFPTQFDQLWPLAAEGDWVVKNDDRLVVLAFTAQGEPRVMWDGFAQIPQVDLGGDGQAVTFSGIGTPIRCWDSVIAGAYYRHGDRADSTDPDDVVYTDRPARFNPGDESAPSWQGNCTPAGKDVDQETSVTEGEPTNRPVFLDEKLVRDPQPQTKWTAGKAVRYLVATYNPQTDPDDADFTPFVDNPPYGEWSQIDDLLKARSPKEGSQFYDPNDSDTYDATDIELRDYDASNKAWPDVVAELCSFANAAFRFELTQNDDAEPVWTLKFFRKDASDPLPPLDLHLQAAPDLLDLSQTNAAELHLARDAHAIVNDYVIETGPELFEFSVVLGLGFTPVAGDESAANRKTFLMSALEDADADKRKMYRLYVGDEAGDGHYDTDIQDWITDDALDLDAVLGEPDDEEGPLYAHRLRPGRRKLITLGADGKPMQAVLSLSRDYAGLAPAVWDGTGTWQPIEGSWQLLKDRLGIYVTAEDPEAWEIGAYKGSNPQNPGRTLRGVTCQASPSNSEIFLKRFYLMLTCVIEGDRGIVAGAAKRDASPTSFTIGRRIDSRDHFKKETVHESSLFNDGDTSTHRDDQKKAVAHAAALRAANEFPPLAGAVTIPWLSNAYRVGRRLRMIRGRDVVLSTNAGEQAGEAENFPYIVGVEYDFSGEQQSTRLRFSDRQRGPMRA